VNAMSVFHTVGFYWLLVAMDSNLNPNMKAFLHVRISVPSSRMDMCIPFITGTCDSKLEGFNYLCEINLNHLILNKKDNRFKEINLAKV